MLFRMLCCGILNLSHCCLGDEDAVKFAMVVEKNTTLKKLYLAYIKITDVGAAYLAHLLTNNHWLEFDINANSISPKGIRFLPFALNHNKHLYRLESPGFFPDDPEPTKMRSICEKDRRSKRVFCMDYHHSFCSNFFTRHVVDRQLWNELNIFYVFEKLESFVKTMIQN